MSMLKNFFEIGTDKNIFNGLDISKETDLCEKYMGQYPVISLSLKDVSGLNFEEAKTQMQEIINIEAERLFYLEDKIEWNQADCKVFQDIINGKSNLESSLLQLSRLLYSSYAGLAENAKKAATD